MVRNLANKAVAWGARLWRGIRNHYEAAVRWTTTRSRVPGRDPADARVDIDRASRVELMRKARYWEKNSAIVNRMADLYECYVIGCGTQISPASSDPEWNKLAAAWWERWTENADLATRQPYGTVQSLMARCEFIDGEAFQILTRGPSGRPRIQCIESHRCETPPALAQMEGESIVDGVEVDPNGRPTGYWFKREHPKGNRIEWTQIPADFVVHIYEPSRPEQVRGVTGFYPVLNDLHDLEDLQLLEMKKARDAAEITNVIKTASGELSPRDLRRRRFALAGTLSDDSTATEETRSEYYRSTAGGRTIVLKTGDDLHQHRSDQPGAATQAYWRYLTEKVCAGRGLPYVLVFPDSMQGTVYRGALDSANSWFKARFSVHAAAAKRTYAYVMGWAIRNAPELRNAPPDALLCTVHPPRSVNVDVGRNSAAMLAELAAGATTYDLIYGPMGLDWRTQFDRLAEQQAYAKSIGLILPGMAPPAPPENPMDPEDAAPMDRNRLAYSE